MVHSRSAFFGRIAPEKGIARTRGSVSHHAAVGRIAGSDDSKRQAIWPRIASRISKQIQKQLKDAGLGHEFHYRGVMDRADKIAFLRGLDVMSLPATYDEPKGVSLLESMACGVPVVQPRRGAFTEIVERTGGGLLVQPDDPQSLAEGILKIADDQELAKRTERERLSKASASTTQPRTWLIKYSKLITP